jgi:hypothetical protein
MVVVPAPSQPARGSGMFLWICFDIYTAIPGVKERCHHILIVSRNGAEPERSPIGLLIIRAGPPERYLEPLLIDVDKL